MNTKNSVKNDAISPVTCVACIGGGVIGAGWAARLIENGIDVSLFDPAGDASEKMQAVLENADRAYAKLTMAQRPVKGRLRYCDTLAAAVNGAQWIIESVPERLEVKRAVYAQIEQFATPDTPIASSTLASCPQISRRICINHSA